MYTRGKRERGALGVRKKIFLLAALIVACLVALYSWSSGQTESSDRLIEMSSEGLQDFIDNEDTGLVYIGRPTCPLCREFLPMYEEVLEQNDLVSYYYHTDHAREDNEEEMIRILDSISVDSVPTVIYFENGVEKGRLTGEISEEDVRTWLVTMLKN